MPTAAANGLDIHYETHGDPSHPALLLIAGFTAQLTSWPEGFVDALVDTGHHVIRFDNRDAGLSTKSITKPPDPAAVLTAAVTGRPELLRAPYTLSDMALDAVGLLDHLQTERAHVVGVSMGGMIVQHLAIEHQDRISSATSIMSTTGDPAQGMADPELIAAMLAPPPVEFEAAIAHAVEVNRLLAGPLWDRDAAVVRTRTNMERSFHPAGAGFQIAAIAASGDRTDQLGAVELPFLVIHGREDRLITPSGGEATANAVPGAELLLMDDMGHDLPEPLWPQIVDAIGGIAGKASGQ